MPHRIALAAVALTALLAVAATMAATAQEPPEGVAEIAITAVPITAFSRDGAPATSSGGGRLRFAGGLVLTSPHPRFGALSGLHVAGERLLAVADTGYWLSARIERVGGRVTGLRDARLGPLLSERGNTLGGKWEADAEALTLRNGRAFVSMEQVARVLTFRLDGQGGLAGGGRTVFSLPRGTVRRSFGLEALTALPDGKLLAISEDRPDGELHAAAFLIGVAGAERLQVRLSDGYYVTDAATLPLDGPFGGDVLLLERNFTPLHGAQIRIRHIARDDIAPGALLDGAVWLEAGRGTTIDNMEGLAAFTDAAGRTRLALVSDDNHWLLQRTLYLEFTLEDDDQAG